MTDYPIVVVNQPRQHYFIPIMSAVGSLLLIITFWFSVNWFQTQPNIAVEGIAEAYVEGESIRFKLAWSEGDVMKKVSFKIPEAGVNKIWHTDATRGTRNANITTVGWLPIQYTYVATFIAQNDKSYSVSGKFHLDKRDIVQPSSQIIGIENHYNVGTEITYTLQAVDNRALQKAIFMVHGTPVEQSWDMNTQQIAYQASFSTKGWEANRYYHYLFIVIDDVGNQFDRSGKFWLEEVDRILPEGMLSGIQSEYTIGDKVNYKFKVSDNEKLKQVIFKVKPDRVNQIWHTSNTSSEQQSSFLTKHWQAGEYEYQLKIVDHINNAQIITGKFTLNEPKPIKEQTQSFAGQLMGINQNYLVGDTINYSLENYHQYHIKTLLFEVQPDMKETIWHEDEIKPVISNSFSTNNWQHGVYSYFITAFGAENEILQRQHGTFTLTQPIQSFKTKVVNLLETCQQHFAARRYTVGKKGTALNCYRQVLELDPHNAEAKKGIKAIEIKYQVFVENALQRERWQNARLYLSRLAEVNPQSPEIHELEKRLQTLQNQATKRQAIKHEQSQPKVVPKPVAKKVNCSHCSCEELLTKLSIGVEPLTSEEQAYQRAYCQ